MMVLQLSLIVLVVLSVLSIFGWGLHFRLGVELE